MANQTNDLTIYSAQVSIDPKAFKSKKLYQYALRINAAREAAATVVLNAAADAKLARDKFEREAGKVLAEVQDGKAYEADGYKSAADFAAAVFGLNKSDCSSYIRAHKMRAAYPELDAMPRTNIDRLTAADSKSVKAAIESKELTPESTQETLKTFVADHPAKPKAAKVLPTFDLYAIGGEKSFLSSVLADNFADAITRDIGEAVIYSAVCKVPGKYPHARYIAFNDEGCTYMFEARPHVKATPKADKADRAARMGELLDAFKAGQMDYDTFRAKMESLA